jgi:hypothetical protein
MSASEPGSGVAVATGLKASAPESVNEPHDAQTLKRLRLIPELMSAIWKMAEFGNDCPCHEKVSFGFAFKSSRTKKNGMEFQVAVKKKPGEGNVTSGAVGRDTQVPVQVKVAV